MTPTFLVSVHFPTSTPTPIPIFFSVSEFRHRHCTDDTGNLVVSGKSRFIYLAVFPFFHTSKLHTKAHAGDTGTFVLCTLYVKKYKDLVTGYTNILMVTQVSEAE